MIKIHRLELADCSIGQMVETESGFKCFTLELPWQDNTPNLSCIPKGTYEAYKHNSLRNGICFQLRDVPGRAHIQIHVGNFSYQTAGCILVGDSIKFLDADNTPDVTNSRKTLSKLMQLCDDTFKVEIL